MCLASPDAWQDHRIRRVAHGHASNALRAGAVRRQERAERPRLRRRRAGSRPVGAGVRAAVALRARALDKARAAAKVRAAALLRVAPVRGAVRVRAAAKVRAAPEDEARAPRVRGARSEPAAIVAARVAHAPREGVRVLRAVSAGARGCAVVARTRAKPRIATSSKNSPFASSSALDRASGRRGFVRLVWRGRALRPHAERALRCRRRRSGTWRPRSRCPV
jgi:hypothetical protein